MIGKTMRIRGEVTGDEDVLLDGKLEGKIELSKNLTIGRNAEVRADVQAASVAIGGQLQGNVVASTRVEVDGSARFSGNITAPRISIADGAYFEGTIAMTGRGEDGKR